MTTYAHILGLFRGAGQEVGRSCIMIEYKGKKIMVRINKLSKYDHLQLKCLAAGLRNPSWTIWNGCSTFRRSNWGGWNRFASHISVSVCNILSMLFLMNWMLFLVSTWIIVALCLGFCWRLVLKDGVLWLMPPKPFIDGYFQIILKLGNNPLFIYL